MAQVQLQSRVLQMYITFRLPPRIYICGITFKIGQTATANRPSQKTLSMLFVSRNLPCLYECTFKEKSENYEKGEGGERSQDRSSGIRPAKKSFRWRACFAFSRCFDFKLQLRAQHRSIRRQGDNDGLNAHPNNSLHKGVSAIVPRIFHHQHARLQYGTLRPT